jgi:hypothetical protein
MLNIALAIAPGTLGPLVGWLLDRTGVTRDRSGGYKIRPPPSRGATFTALCTAYLIRRDRVFHLYTVRVYDYPMVHRTARPRPENFSPVPVHSSGCR